jgi:hypothetical protein
VSTLEPEEVVTAVVEDGRVNGTEKTLEVVEVQQEQQGQEREQGDADDAAALSLEERVAQLELRVTDVEENLEVGTSLSIKPMAVTTTLQILAAAAEVVVTIQRQEERTNLAKPDP